MRNFFLAAGAFCLLCLPSVPASAAFKGIPYAPTRQFFEGPALPKIHALTLNKHSFSIPENSGVVLKAKELEKPQPLSRRKESVESILGRKPGEEPKTVGRFFKKAGFGLLGFLGGLVFGALIGAGIAGYLLATTQNPSFQGWKKWVVFLPVLAAGAAVGQVIIPISLSRFYQHAKKYSP